jgi:hypothetical protein
VHLLDQVRESTGVLSNIQPQLQNTYNVQVPPEKRGTLQNPPGGSKQTRLIWLQFNPRFGFFLSLGPRIDQTLFCWLRCNQSIARRLIIYDNVSVKIEYPDRTNKLEDYSIFQELSYHNAAKALAWTAGQEKINFASSPQSSEQSRIANKDFVCDGSPEDETIGMGESEQRRMKSNSYLPTQL